MAATSVTSTAVAQPQPADRISRLEALRGLAALAVLVTHCFLTVPWDGHGVQVRLIWFSCIVVFNAHTAVIVFFVISGYVLGLSLDRGAARPHNFSRFYIRRIFRLYPAHVVALGFIAITLSSFDHTARPPAASPLFGALFPASLSPVSGLMNALLLRVDLNGIVWTLSLEMAISLVFPLLYLASRHSSAWVRVTILVALVAVSRVFGDRSTDLGGAMINTSRPGTLEAVIAQFAYVPQILNNLVLYSYVFYVGLVAEPVFKTIMPRIEGRLGSWLMYLALPCSLPAPACGATFVVFCAALMKTGNLFIRALDHPFLARLGEISYSFYLYHLIVAYCIATVMFHLLDPNWIHLYPLVFVLTLTAITVLVTAAIATASYRLVEVPMISFSKRTPIRRSATMIAVPAGVAMLVLLPFLSAIEPVKYGASAPASLIPAHAADSSRDRAVGPHAPDVSTEPGRSLVAASLPLHLAFGDSAARRWTLAGWYDVETAGGGSFAWSKGDRSVVTVRLPTGRDIRLDFEALPFVSPGSPPQAVTIGLNGTRIRTVFLRPNKNAYSVVLPATALHVSLDTLDFQYAYVKAPSQVPHGFLGLGPKSLDVRVLAVAWYSMDFANLKPSPH